MGVCYQRLKQWEDAYKEYTWAIEISKAQKTPNGEYYYNWATVQGKMKKYKEAVSDYNKAIENELSSTKSGDEIKFKAKFFKGIALWKQQLF